MLIILLSLIEVNVSLSIMLNNSSNLTICVLSPPIHYKQNLSFLTKFIHNESYLYSLEKWCHIIDCNVLPIKILTDRFCFYFFCLPLIFIFIYKKLAAKYHSFKYLYSVVSVMIHLIGKLVSLTMC